MPSPGLLIAACAVLLISPCAFAQGGIDEPWPFWGRTASRIGNTTTIGPQTPNIEWSVQFTTHASTSIREASPVMDQWGRVFVAGPRGMAAIGSYSQERIWEDMPGDHGRGVAVWKGRVLWGDVLPFATLYCYDAKTGQPIWTFQAPEVGFNHSAPVVGPNDVVYIADGFGSLYARRLQDGSEVWTRNVGPEVRNAPSLEATQLLFTGSGNGGQDETGVDPISGTLGWTYRTGRDVRGIDPVIDGRVFIGSWDRFLHAVDTTTGQEIWRFDCGQLNRGSTAIGHDGTIYTCTHGNIGTLFAILPDGQEAWRYETAPITDVLNAPVVAGDGTIYFCSYVTTDRIGHVHAVRPDGSVLWVHRMPDQVQASPMLAPDGTLYIVCRDRNLYAFKDPWEKATLTSLDVTLGTIMDGDLSRLNEADDNYLRIRSQFGFSAAAPNIVRFDIVASTTIQQPRFIGVEVEGKLNNPGGITRYFLKNWKTKQFDEVRTYGLGIEEFRGWVYQLDGSLYARPISGRIELRVEQSVIATFAATGFESSIDYVEIEVME